MSQSQANDNRPCALVTGGSSGLGNAFCEQLADAGFRVISVDRSEQATAAAVKHIQCDLSHGEALAALKDELRAHAPFDMVIMNAAASATGKFERLPIAEQLKLMTLNAETPLLLSSWLAGEGLMTRGAHLVFIASLSHQTGYPGASVYAATKDALAVYAKSIRKPFARLGIAVSCAFPGPMATAQAARHAPAGSDAAKRMPPHAAAAAILTAARRGRFAIYPDAKTRSAAYAGKFAPRLVTRVMRGALYEKLDREVW